MDRSMEGSDFMPFWCFVWRDTFQIKQNYNLALFCSLFFFSSSFFKDCHGVKDDQQQVWQNLSLFLSAHCSAMWGAAPCSSVFTACCTAGLLPADNTRDYKLIYVSLVQDEERLGPSSATSASHMIKKFCKYCIIRSIIIPEDIFYLWVHSRYRCD